MPKVQVWNDNAHDFKQKFKGDEIKISAKSWIWMDADDAHSFQGAFSPPVLGVDGNHKPEGFKMIRIEKSDKAPADDKPSSVQTQANVCPACRYQAGNEKDLAEHQTTMHASQLLKDEVAEEAIKSRKKTG
jgi:hypothetical protein